MPFVMDFQWPGDKNIFRLKQERKVSANLLSIKNFFQLLFGWFDHCVVFDT